MGVWLVELFILDWRWQQAPCGGIYLSLILLSLRTRNFSTSLDICHYSFDTPRLENNLNTTVGKSYINWLFWLCTCDGRVLNSLNIPLSVETVCVFTAPIFSAFAAWATYLLTKVCSWLSWSVFWLYLLTLVAYVFLFVNWDLWIMFNFHFYRKLRAQVLDWLQQFFWPW